MLLLNGFFIFMRVFRCFYDSCFGGQSYCKRVCFFNNLLVLERKLLEIKQYVHKYISNWISYLQVHFEKLLPNYDIVMYTYILGVVIVQVVRNGLNVIHLHTMSN